MTAIPEAQIVERVEPNKTKQFLFIQGTLEMEVFDDQNGGVLKSIDAIDKLPPGRWTEFAIQNDLPCDPLDRKLLKPPLQGIIQIAWTRHFVGVVSERLLANQERRVATYIHDLEHIKIMKDTPTDKMVRGRTTNAEGKPKTPAIGYLYRLRNETAETWSKFTSQKGYLVAVMLASGACGEKGVGISKDLITGAVRGKLNTKQPEERVVGFYLSEWSKDGIVERVDEGAGKSAGPAEGWEANVMTPEKVKEIEKEVAGQKAKPAPKEDAKSTKPSEQQPPSQEPKKKAAKKAAAKK